MLSPGFEPWCKVSHPVDFTIPTVSPLAQTHNTTMGLKHKIKNASILENKFRPQSYIKLIDYSIDVWLSRYYDVILKCL
jgi:hypothetical protein